MKLTLLSIVLLSTLASIKCDAEEYANADLFTQQFYRLKHKYDIVCQKPGTVISFNTSYKLIQKCLEPEMDQLKKDNPLEVNDGLYPDHWKNIINICFKKHVKNFCLRSQEGKVLKDKTEWTIDQALYCVGTKSYAFLSDLKKLYKNNADKVLAVANRQKKCLDNFLDNVEANYGEYKP